MRTATLFLLVAGSAALKPSMQPLPASLARLRGGNVQAVSPTKTPAETYAAYAAKGEINANTPLPKLLHQAFMGGMYVAIGGVFALTVAGAFPKLGPDGQRLVIACLFPIGLIFILQACGQLMTGNFAVVSAAFYEGKVDLPTVARSFALTGLGNLLGCLTISLCIQSAGLLKGGTAELAAAIAVKKCSAPLGQTLIKAVLCNWLVSLAIFLSSMCNDMPGKVLSIWSCIPMFVMIGLEHSVANMFFLPFGKMGGAPLSAAQIVTKNLAVVTLGNLIGGGGLLAAGMSYQCGALGEEAPKAAPKAVASEEA